MSEDSFEVTTFNVRRLDEFEWLDGDQTRQDIATWLAEQPDGIWCFQEFPSEESHVAFGRVFVAQAPAPAVHVASRGWPALASSYPVKDWTTYMFEDEDADKAACFKPMWRRRRDWSGCSTFTFKVCTSTTPTTTRWKKDQAGSKGPACGVITDASKARALQAQELVRRMEESPYPVIVAGDFNDTPMSYAMHALRGSRAEDTLPRPHLGLAEPIWGPSLDCASTESWPTRRCNASRTTPTAS